MKAGIAMMREALGTEAAHVTFFDVSAAYTRPARTLRVPQGLVEQLRETPMLRAVADVQFGLIRRVGPMDRVRGDVQSLL